MKNIYVIVACVLLAACNQSNMSSTKTATVNTDSLRTELMNTDKAWNDATQQKGYFHSRIDYVADDGIELSNGEMPLNGKAAISDYAAKNSDSTLKVSWVASKAEVAASGDLGYTYGTYTDQMKTKSGRDTTIYGNYVTVWKKQPDGSWKFLVDGSTNTPKPM